MRYRFSLEFVRTNYHLWVIHDAGGYTAWSDKHPAYTALPAEAAICGRRFLLSGNQLQRSCAARSHHSHGISCAAIRDPDADLTAWTNSFQNIQCYDTLKVNAIVNQIHGKTHSGLAGKVPVIFGMNFQAVSVGQKLIERGVTGGYLDAKGVPSASLLSEIEYVDASIGDMVNALKSTGLFENTLIVITAKHGQSPIDPNLYKAHPGKTNNGTSPANLLASLLPDSESPANPTGIGPTEDDISLLWLKPGSDVKSAVQTLEKNATAIGLGQIFYGPTVSLNYNTPGLGRAWIRARLTSSSPRT